MSFIKINNLNIYYEKKGNKGKKVILLHGWGQNTSMMDFIAEHLKKHFIVYNIDFPGFGESDLPNEAWGVNEYSEFLKAFIDKKKIENPILIGHSFGCRVALEYAYKYDVNKMILTGAAGIRPTRHLDYYFKVYTYKLIKKILSINCLEKYKEKYINKAGSSDYQNTSGILRQSFVKIVNEDLKPILKDIDTPTLLVWGENDSDVPLKYGRMMEELMPNATLVIFEKDDHYAYFHQANRFNAVLDAYLKEDE